MPFPICNESHGIKTNHQGFLHYPENLSNEGTLLGVKKVQNEEIKIKMSDSDIGLHSYILGQTGTGKSTLLYTMMMDMINNGKGIGLIDPHGDLFEKVYKNIPENRKKDIVLFQPDDLNNVYPLNILEHDINFTEQKGFIISVFYSMLDDLYDMKQTGGPMFYKYMNFALNFVMDTGGTIQHIIRFFQTKEYREQLFAECKDANIMEEWKEMRSAGSDASLENISPYVTSKLSEFMNNPYVKKVVTQNKESINFRNIIDNKKIFLAKLSKGKLGAKGVNLLGMILLSRFMMAAFTRENTPESNRLDFSLFIDEFQNITTKELILGFSEARKYHLNLIVANQNLFQLKQDILQSVMGNVGNLIFFRPGVYDIDNIIDYLKPHFTKEDIINLPNFNAIARIQVNNAPTKPFVFKTIS